MKRFFSITAVVVLGFAALASAQSATPKPLADVAKDEEARRKSVRKPAKVYTNGSLRPDTSKGAKGPAVPAPSAEAPADANPATATPGAPDAGAAAATGGKDQAYWSGRIKDARAAETRTQIIHDSLQSRINALTADAANRDYPSRGQVEQQRNAALAELERAKKELEEQTTAIAAIEEEARRAGVPPGWLRPGA
jgi:hypothetical protein